MKHVAKGKVKARSAGLHPRSAAPVSHAALVSHALNGCVLWFNVL